MRGSPRRRGLEGGERSFGTATRTQDDVVKEVYTGGESTPTLTLPRRGGGDPNAISLAIGVNKTLAVGYFVVFGEVGDGYTGFGEGAGYVG